MTIGEPGSDNGFLQAVTTFALSPIGQTTAGHAAAGGTKPDTPSPDGASAFDMLLQSTGNNTPAATPGNSTPAATPGTAGASVSPSADGAKPATSATEASDAAPAAGKQSAADGATGATDQSPAGSDAATAGGTDQADDGKAPPPASASTATDEAVAASGPAADTETPAFDPKLLHDLTSALAELEQDEKNGTAPSKDLLKRLQQAVNALSGYLAALQPGATPALADTPAAAAPDGAGAGISGVSGVSAALQHLLGALSDAAPGSGTGPHAATAGAGTGSTAVGDATSPALAQLADKLEALSSALTQSQPSLSNDLDRLAKQLEHLPASNAQQAATAPAGDAAKPGLTAATASGPPAATLPQSATAKPANTKDAAAATPEHATVKAGSSQPADSKAAAGKASDDKGAGVDGKRDATAGAPTANAAGTAPAPSAQSASSGTGAAPTNAIAPASAQPPTGPGAAAAQQAQAAYQAADTATANLPQMAFEIARQVQHGTSEFQIRLDPADLGRVNVTLAVDATGNVNAHLAVERADTLALLRQDANNLNQALAQAGLAGGKTNLQFSLSQNPFARQDSGGQPAGPAPAPAGDEQAIAPVPAAPAITRYRGSFATSNLNIFV